MATVSFMSILALLRTTASTTTTNGSLPLESSYLSLSDYCYYFNYGHTMRILGGLAKKIILFKINSYLIFDNPSIFPMITMFSYI